MMDATRLGNRLLMAAKDGPMLLARNSLITAATLAGSEIVSKKLATPATKESTGQEKLEYRLAVALANEVDEITESVARLKEDPEALYLPSAWGKALNVIGQLPSTNVPLITLVPTEAEFLELSEAISTGQEINALAITAKLNDLYDLALAGWPAMAACYFAHELQPSEEAS